MSNYNRVHDDTVVNSVKVMYDKKTPILEIALFHNLNKNETTGIIWRHVKKKKRNPVKKLLAKIKVKKSPPDRRIKIPTFKPLSFKPRTYKPHEPIFMEDLTSDTCREVIGDPKNMRCCGEPIGRGSYCNEHARINYK